MLWFSMLAMVLGGIASAHAANPVTIFGVPLGEPFVVPQCADPNPAVVTSTCWTYEFSMPEAANMRSLHFANPPALGHSITAFVDNGIMDIVTAETAGVEDQDYVMSQLTQKFGKPIRFQKVPVQNRMGAKFVVYRAEWSAPDYVVRFDADGSDNGGHEGTLDKGWISIETQKANAEGLKKQQNAPQQPL